MLVHDFVILELACGSIPKRSAFLADLGRLPFAPVVSLSESLTYIEKAKLFGIGIGAVDASLIISARAIDADLFTYDRKMQSAWNKVS